MHKPVQYSDGVPYDTETMRVEQCPRCHNTEFSPKAQYCRICGASLYNYCDGGYEDYEGRLFFDEERRRRPNPSNARFCETCGRPTHFFDSRILCDYTKYVPETDG